MSTESTKQTHAVKQGNIVITMIDDEEIGHFIFQMIAREIAGLETAVFSNGQDVIDLIREEKFKTDLILLDINMPFMDGWAFLDAFEPFNLRKPVFIVSSSTDVKDMEKAKKYKSVKGFYSKPISQSHIQTIVDLALSGSLN